MGAINKSLREWISAGFMMAALLGMLPGVTNVHGNVGISGLFATISCALYTLEAKQLRYIIYLAVFILLMQLLRFSGLLPSIGGISLKPWIFRDSIETCILVLGVILLFVEMRALRNGNIHSG